ncbi:lysozyme [Rubrivirga sp.]|uniref:lysozyme n=1 Tax=Rubrivirga sp. TaxID=1885344 RepID=UPI003B52515F
MPHPDNAALRISDPGLTLIQQFEGFEPDWYLDAVGVRTIGYGWTGALPDDLAPPLTEAQGRRLLADTVGAYGAAVVRHVEVPLAQAQFDALVSFTYNLGASNLASSTLLARLNEGRWDEAAAEFDRWVLAGGRRLEGLVRRRAAERALFESARAVAPPAEPTPGDDSPRPPASEMERIPARPPHLDDGPPPPDVLPPDRPRRDDPRPRGPAW